MNAPALVAPALMLAGLDAAIGARHLLWAVVLGMALAASVAVILAVAVAVVWRDVADDA